MTVHPAVVAYRQAAYRYPPKAMYAEIAAAVGDKPDDLLRLSEIVRSYVGAGGNPSNAIEILRRFRANGKPRADAIAAAADKWRRKQNAPDN